MTEAKRVPITPLVETDDYKLAYMRGTGDRLVVSLGGVGTVPDEMPPFEFVGTASDAGQNHVILVTEKARTWMNSPELTRAILEEVETVVSRENIRDVVTLGNSMGGFMALVLPTLTRVDCAVAVSPQFSMHKSHVPEETRWRKWRNRFPGYAFETVGALDVAGTDYYVFHGDTPEERIHWARFPQTKKLHHFILRGQEHNLVKLMKTEGILTEAIHRAINRTPRRVRRLLEAHFDAIRRDHLPAHEAFATETPQSTGTGEHP